MCISILPCFPDGRMRYRNLEHAKLQALHARGFRWGKTMPVTSTDHVTLAWWLKTITNNKPHMFAMVPISLTLWSDASLQGWGITLDSGERTGFRFSKEVMHHPINTKELLAIYYGILTFRDKIRRRHILVKSDSTTVVADVRKMGSMCNTFRNKLVNKIYTVLAELQARISITFVSGASNVIADEKSRVFTSVTSEWTLDKDTFQLIFSRFPELEIDLFASHLNNQLPLFCSWMPTPGCFHTDAFTFDWNSKLCFCFPPNSLYLKCFDHVRTAKIHRVVFVVPWHPTSVWFPLMQSLLVQAPWFLPKNTVKKMYLPFQTEGKRQ